MNRKFNLLDVDDIIPEKEDAPTLAISGAQIRFDNVTFGYTEKRTILKNVSFEIPPGKTVAVVGKSGSGKSTLVRLLFRFYDVNEGQISVDGQNIKDVSLDSLHGAIGVVPQDTVLFNDSIEYNICYGRPGCVDAEFKAAVEQANLYEFVESLPEKYDTVVGERGLKLSGGEKQRVSIARTILKDPPILILDEATSSLDSKSEQYIQNALDMVAENRTTLMIAHRLSTIADADRIIVLDNGEIVEEGTHAELLRKNGVFAEMWWLQQVEETDAKLAEMAATPKSPPS
ncbi:MAG: ATP-binding cassette domain-containing protein, partial [Gammaproteobacteria bacterium]|nr:ATP-binding cassette domain-containing protein [Gammaproteobacteria bacterium]